MERCPAVVHAFYKDRHKYSKDYGIETHTLGRQIMEWWSEICPPGTEPRIRFGGPTGISTFVVLLTWWCSQLKVKPYHKWNDCLRTLEEVDCALVAAISNIKNPPATSTSILSSVAPPPSRPRKRATNGETSPSKRRRVRKDPI